MIKENGTYEDNGSSTWADRKRPSHAMSGADEKDTRSQKEPSHQFAYAAREEPNRFEQSPVPVKRKRMEMSPENAERLTEAEVPQLPLDADCLQLAAVACLNVETEIIDSTDNTDRQYSGTETLQNSSELDAVGKAVIGMQNSKEREEVSQTYLCAHEMLRQSEDPPDTVDQAANNSNAPNDVTKSLQVQEHKTGERNSSGHTVKDAIVSNQDCSGESSNIVPKSLHTRNKKLLVLDINGLLADIVSPIPKDYKSDTNIARRAIFKRPFCNEFLIFCFERYEVGIWSSRTQKNVEKIIDFLLGDLKDRLLFCWDVTQCTPTGFSSLENKYKKLMFKELRKLWEPQDFGLSWENGHFNESNTLLVDDSPYKALLNPPHTAIFPLSFTYQNRSDNSLGVGGDIYSYLEEVAESDNVQNYIEQHPFGQTPISKTNPSWDFYYKATISLFTMETPTESANL